MSTTLGRRLTPTAGPQDSAGAFQRSDVPPFTPNGTSALDLGTLPVAMAGAAARIVGVVAYEAASLAADPPRDDGDRGAICHRNMLYQADLSRVGWALDDHKELSPFRDFVKGTVVPTIPKGIIGTICSASFTSVMASRRPITGEEPIGHIADAMQTAAAWPKLAEHDYLSIRLVTKIRTGM